MSKNQSLKKTSSHYVSLITAEYDSVLREETVVNLLSEIEIKIIHNESEVSLYSEEQQIITMIVCFF